MHYYNFSVLFSRDHDLIFSWSRHNESCFVIITTLNFLCVFGMRKCYRSSIIAASWMIVFAFTFDQGLTQTEIALCLSVIDDLHTSVRHLRRRLSGLQLYRRRQYSDPERVVKFNFLGDAPLSQCRDKVHICCRKLVTLWWRYQPLARTP